MHQLYSGAFFLVLAIALLAAFLYTGDGTSAIGASVLALLSIIELGSALRKIL